MLIVRIASRPITWCRYLCWRIYTQPSGMVARIHCTWAWWHSPPGLQAMHPLTLNSVHALARNGSPQWEVFIKDASLPAHQKEALKSAESSSEYRKQPPAEGRQSVQLTIRCTSGLATPSANSERRPAVDAAAFHLISDCALGVLPCYSSSALAVEVPAGSSGISGSCSSCLCKTNTAQHALATCTEHALGSPM